MTQHELSQPTLTQCERSPPSSPIENDESEDELEDELHNNDIGDVETNCVQEEMDHDVPYNRCYASDSEDDGPEEDVDEDGFTAKEAQTFKKVTGRDHRTSLFRDLSLADKAVVDGGTSKLLGPRPSSKKDMAPEKYGISEGVKFESFLELKTWLKEYAVKYYRPFRVVHSDVSKRYTVKCEDAGNGCPWIVRALTPYTSLTWQAWAHRFGYFVPCSSRTHFLVLQACPLYAEQAHRHTCWRSQSQSTCPQPARPHHTGAVR